MSSPWRYQEIKVGHLRTRKSRPHDLFFCVDARDAQMCSVRSVCVLNSPRPVMKRGMSHSTMQTHSVGGAPTYTHVHPSNKCQESKFSVLQNNKKNPTHYLRSRRALQIETPMGKNTRVRPFVGCRSLCRVFTHAFSLPPLL